MPIFVKVKALLLPLLLILSNGVLGWLINQLPSKQDLHIPDSTIFWLTGGCIVVLLILTLLSSDPQQNAATANQNWLGGLLPLVGGITLFGLYKSNYVPAESTTAVLYISLMLFALGTILPPVLLLPKKWQKRVLWFFPATGVAIAVHFFLAHQWPAAVLSFLVTVILTLFILIGKFLIEFIKRISQKWKDWQKTQAVRLADQIWSKFEVWTWTLTSDFQAKYYKNLVYTYRTYRTQGLKTPGAFTPDLDKVFVPLRVTSKSPQQMSQALIQKQETVGNLQIWDFLAEIRTLTAYRRMLVIAPPGYGKTTLLEHLTLQYAQNTQRRRYPKAPKIIPVLLYLRKIRDEITSPQPPNLAQLIIKVLQTPEEPSLKLDPPPQWFENRLKGGKCLVMLDGLDEVADKSQRQRVSQWVDAQMRTYPETTFILTSRPYGYLELDTPLQQQPLSLEVQPFNLKQMEQFLRNWYLQNEIMRQARKEDPGVRADAQRKANDLIECIENHPPLAAMALNPLLLTMIATVHDNRGALPGSRVELYAEICEVLLVRRQQVKGIEYSITLNAAQKQSVLQVLALQLMLQKTREFNSSVGEQIIQQQLQAVSGNQIEPKIFIEHIQQVSSLLIPKKEGVFEFAHKSLQEYLTAVQVQKGKNEQILIDNMNDSWWDETIRLYAAKNDTTNLILAALQNPTVISLSIAYDCLQEGESVVPAVKQQLEDRLEAGLESDNAQIASLAAQVKLSRRLKQLLRIDENLEIDTGYITCAEYQLFIDDKRSGQTLHLQNTRFPAGNANNLIVGMSWENALGFCSWLNLYTLSQSGNSNENNPVYYYRLPTLAEAQNDSVKARCWTIDGSNTGEKRIRFVKNRVDQEYTKLANYLAVGDWEKAAQSTAKVMLKVANRESEGEFDVASIQNLPSSCLSTIDLLWMQYSTGRFGWGVRISVGLPPTKSDLRCGWWLNASGNVKDIFEALVQKHIACGRDRLPPLFAFDCVTVNAQGQEIQWERHQSQYFTEDLGNGVTLDMVAIRGGTFTMGSPSTEAESLDSERPQHEVTVPPFFMGKYPITQAQWRAIASRKDLKVERDLEANPSRFKDRDRCPVEKVSWYDAVEFCARLSQYTGKSYRLPSEAEWEYACRAGTTTPFHFGETITSELANYRATETYGAGVEGTYREKTTEVGSFGVANAFGLYDMHGNVWEWCLDDWHKNYEGAPTDGSPWFYDNDNLYQKQANAVLRGGSWILLPKVCRSASRDNYDGAERDNFVNLLGFRVVCAVGRILQ
jgi:formylglycine-generating enzyme required for sulfatase activity